MRFMHTLRSLTAKGYKVKQSDPIDYANRLVTTRFRFRFRLSVTLVIYTVIVILVAYVQTTLTRMWLWKVHVVVLDNVLSKAVPEICALASSVTEVGCLPVPVTGVSVEHAAVMNPYRLAPNLAIGIANIKLHHP